MSPFGVFWRVALILLGAAALVPIRTGSLAPRPKPAAGYEAAMVLAQQLERADSAATPDGKSVVLVHGHRTPRAFVFFHGLSNSPRQYRQLAATVYDGGDNVVVPRLPWHGLKGETASNLGRITAEQLRDMADATVNIASGLGDTVIVCGVSLGGNIAAWVVQFRTIDRAVLVAPALGLSHLSTMLETPAMNLMLRAPNYSKHEPPDTVRPDRTLGWSTRGVGEMFKLGMAVRRNADDHAPLARDIRVLANANDGTINHSALNELVAHWSAKGARLMMYELSDTLALPHDIIDPDEETGKTSVTNPIILALLYGSLPTASQGVRMIPLGKASK